MDEEVFSYKILPFLKKYWLPLALALFGLVFFGYGLIALMNQNKKSQDDIFTKPYATNSSQNSTINTSEISIDIEGAVVLPGVYKLSADSIVQDALVMAKGLSAEADRDFVAKNINLAAKLTDGAKIYIPKTGDGAVSRTQGSTNTSSIAETGLISLNTASSGELDTLPGVGPVTADKIIKGRPYSAINDLLDKKIVTGKVFSEIKDKISAF